MKQKAVFCLLMVLSFSTGFAQQELRSKSPARSGEAAGYSSIAATGLSMMGWGLGLGVGIALLCGMISPDSGSNAHSH